MEGWLVPRHQNGMMQWLSVQSRKIGEMLAPTKPQISLFCVELAESKKADWTATYGGKTPRTLGGNSLIWLQPKQPKSCWQKISRGGLLQRGVLTAFRILNSLYVRERRKSLTLKRIYSICKTDLDTFHGILVRKLYTRRFLLWVR